MDNHEKVINHCKKYEEHENIFGVPRPFIKLAGGIEEAFFLSQIIFWSDRNTTRKDGYFFKSDKDWKSELGLSRYKLDKMRKSLEEKGYIHVVNKKAYGAPTHHYKVFLEKIYEDIDGYYEQQDKNSKREKTKVKEKKQMNMQVSLNSEMQESNDSELLETSNSLTENTHKLTHRLEQKASLISIKELYTLLDVENTDNNDGVEFKKVLFEEMVNIVKLIFPSEDLTEAKLGRLRQIAYSANYVSKNNEKWSPEKLDHRFILDKLHWARELVKNDDSFSFENLITALTRQENLTKHRWWEGTKKGKQKKRETILDFMLTD